MEERERGVGEAGRGSDPSRGGGAGGGEQKKSVRMNIRAFSLAQFHKDQSHAPLIWGSPIQILPLILPMRPTVRNFFGAVLSVT